MVMFAQDGVLNSLSTTNGKDDQSLSELQYNFFREISAFVGHSFEYGSPWCLETHSSPQSTIVISTTCSSTCRETLRWKSNLVISTVPLKMDQPIHAKAAAASAIYIQSRQSQARNEKKILPLHGSCNYQ